MATPETLSTYLQAYEALDDAVIVTDAAARIVYTNGALQRRFGFAPDAVLGRLLTELIRLTDEGQWDRVLAAGESCQCGDGACDAADGRQFRVEWQLTNLELLAAGFVGRVVVVRDVTQLRSAEQMLGETIDRYRAMAANIVDVLWAVDTAGDVIFCSPSIEQLIGYTVEEAIAGGLELFIPEQSLARVIQEIATYVQTPEDERDHEREWRMDVPHRTKDGRVLQAEVVANVWYDAAGRLVGAVGTARDITRRTQELAAARAGEERYRHVVESPLAGIVIFDENGRHLYTNMRLAEIVGYDVDELQGAHFSLYVAPDDLPQAVELFETRGPLIDPMLRYVSDVVGKDGETRTVEFSAYTHTDAAGDDQTIVHVVDITERRRAVAALRQSEGALRTLLNATHDVAVLMDRRGVIEAVNDEFLKVFGGGADRYFGHGLLGFLDPGARVTGQAAFEEILATERPKHVSTEVAGRFFSHTAYPVFDEKGKVAKVALFSRDETDQLKTAAALARSEQRFRAMAEKSPVGIAVFEDGRVVFVNRQGAEMTGYSNEELTLEAGVALIAPEDRERLEVIMVEAVATDVLPGETEFSIVRKDGERRRVRAQYVAINPGGPTLDRMLVARDITDYVSAREALESSEARYRVVSELATDYAFGFSVNAQGEVSLDWVTGAFQRVTGFEVEDLRSAEAWQLLVYEQDVDVAVEFGLALLSGTVQTAEFRINTKGGSQRWLRVTVRPEFDQETGVVVYLYGAAEDITKRRKVENALRDSEREKALILSSVADAIVFLDCDGRTIWANKAAAAAEMPPHPIQQHQRREARPDRPHQWEQSPTARALALRTVQDGEVVGANGRVWEVNANPVCDQEGEVIGVVEVSRDVTRQRQAEEVARRHEQQLLRADKMITLGHLVSGVAHEINNPNQFIMANVSPLRSICEDLKPVVERYFEEHGDFLVAGRNYSVRRDQLGVMFNNISEGAVRIKTIVDELRDFAGGRPSQVKSEVDPNEVLHSALELLANMVKNATDDFHVSYGGDLASVVGNFQRLEQVLINLIQNACQAVAENHAAVRIATTRSPDGGVVVTIADGGLGIAPEDLPHLTDPFFTTKRAAGGTGLGLSIAAQIVNEHRGTLEFSSPPGQGATARVWLPAAPRSAEGDK
jgi:PAS domain S-box-containing protein